MNKIIILVITIPCLVIFLGLFQIRVMDISTPKRKVETFTNYCQPFETTTPHEKFIREFAVQIVGHSVAYDVDYKVYNWFGLNELTDGGLAHVIFE